MTAIPTIASRVKELMAEMPDTLNTKKEIDEYYKDVVKKVKEAMNTGGKAPRKALGVKAPKEPKAAKAPKEPKVAKKRVKKVDVDADGNEIEKVKKPPNAYQKFIQDNRQKVKEDNPTMTGVEIFTLLAQKWNEHKKAMNGEESDDKGKPDSSKSSSKGSSKSSRNSSSKGSSKGSSKKDTSDDDDITEDDDDKKKAAAAAAVAKSVKVAKAKNATNK
jgi:hypothetical protein